VGSYVGGGEFLRAPHTDDVVKISSLSDPHYACSYVGAVRPYATYQDWPRKRLTAREP
jgi:cell wall-associated NlpC family hydrolase